LLVVDGNVQAAREAHGSSYGKTPSQSYADTLQTLAPDAVCDICLPADRGANLPNAKGLEDYDGMASRNSSSHGRTSSYERNRAHAAAWRLEKGGQAAVRQGRIEIFRRPPSELNQPVTRLRGRALVDRGWGRSLQRQRW
jgi:hypothetical protein